MNKAKRFSAFALACLAVPVWADTDYALDSGALRAQLSPLRYATLAAEMTGKVERINVREGQRVNKGDLLVSFDCSLQAAQLQKAKAQLAGARNTFKGSQRMAELDAIGHVELANSRVDVDKARADVAYLQATIKRCDLHAPYAGVVGDKKVRAQEFVQAGEPLLELLDDSRLELEFIVPSAWLSWFTPGYAFDVKIEDTGKVYPVKLAYTAAKVDPLSQSVKAYAFIDGQYAELLAGMSGHLLLAPPAE